jgi:hypothetical protein
MPISCVYEVDYACQHRLPLPPLQSACRRSSVELGECRYRMEILQPGGDKRMGEDVMKSNKWMVWTLVRRDNSNLHSLKPVLSLISRRRKFPKKISREKDFEI